MATTFTPAPQPKQPAHHSNLDLYSQPLYDFDLAHQQPSPTTSSSSASTSLVQGSTSPLHSPQPLHIIDITYPTSYLRTPLSPPRFPRHTAKSIAEVSDDILPVWEGCDDADGDVRQSIEVEVGKGSQYAGVSVLGRWEEVRFQCSGGKGRKRKGDEEEDEMSCTRRSERCERKKLRMA